jgi:hypothetical protein
MELLDHTIHKEYEHHQQNCSIEGFHLNLDIMILDAVRFADYLDFEDNFPAKK